MIRNHAYHRVGNIEFVANLRHGGAFHFDTQHLEYVCADGASPLLAASVFKLLPNG